MKSHAELKPGLEAGAREVLKRRSIKPVERGVEDPLLGDVQWPSVEFTRRIITERHLGFPRRKFPNFLKFNSVAYAFGSQALTKKGSEYRHQPSSVPLPTLVPGLQKTFARERENRKGGEQMPESTRGCTMSQLYESRGFSERKGKKRAISHSWKVGYC